MQLLSSDCQQAEIIAFPRPKENACLSSVQSYFWAYSSMRLFLSVFTIFSALSTTTAALLPSFDCYAVDKENYLLDFTEQIGKELELEGQSSDFVLRFCVDAQNRSSHGYVSFGRFQSEGTLKPDSNEVDFYQVYKNGDLRLCEHYGNNLMGRETQVSVVCGSCPNREVSCKDGFGCICNVSYHHNTCKARVLVAVDCGSRGPRINPGLKIGFQPGGWEVIRNGMTQRAFSKPIHDFGFGTLQRSVSLYMSSSMGFASGNGKAQISVQPSQGLIVDIVSKAAATKHTETESITLLQVNWQCRKFIEQPYEVSIKVPIDGYDPVQFFLSKECKTYEAQKEVGVSSQKIFGAISVIILLVASLYGVLGIAYKFKLQDKGDSDVPLIREAFDEVHEEESSARLVTEVPMVQTLS